MMSCTGANVNTWFCTTSTTIWSNGSTAPDSKIQISQGNLIILIKLWHDWVLNKWPEMWQFEEQE